MTTAAEYVEQALKSGRVIFHVMGEHAGEAPKTFLARKQKDIAELGYTYWYGRSVQPPKARQFCEEGVPTVVLFYERTPELMRVRHGKTRHSGEPTKTENKRFGHMTHVCEGDRDRDPFVPLPDMMLRPGRYVTGLVDAGACGFKFDYLEEVRPERGFHPGEWSSVFRKSAQAGAWCATRCRASDDKTWYIVAVARMCDPYGVWFRGKYGLPRED